MYIYLCAIGGCMHAKSKPGQVYKIGSVLTDAHVG